MTDQGTPARPVRSFTFLFTDVAGSTRLWQDAPEAMSDAIARHDRILATCIAENSGELVKSGSRGDGALAVFTRAADAIVCAVKVQLAFAGEPWPAAARLSVRAAAHTGEAETRDDDYFGPALSRAARLLSTAHGGQIVASSATIEAVKDSTLEGIEFVDLGVHRLKDLYKPERVFQVTAPELDTTFPALLSLDARSNSLPTHLTSFVGRSDELQALRTLLSEARLVTITGMGGAGKTRLATRAAADHVGGFADGVAFVDLAPVRDAAMIPRAFVAALDAVDPAVEAGIDDPEAAAEAVTRHLVRVLSDREELLVVDNCEHVLDWAAQVIRVVLASCPRLRLLATSREPLGIPGEHVYTVPPLATPDPAGPENLETLLACASVRLFCDRARAVRAGFRLTDVNAAGVADVCRQLDGIPLAIELAAARVNALSPAQIAERLAVAPGLLASSGRDVMERHRTLEGALEWSYTALTEEARVLLRRLAVFNGGWSLESAEAVCSGTPVEEAQIFELLGFVVDRSLVICDDDGYGVRYRLLEPVRQFAERKLVAAGEEPDARNRHRDWFVRQAGDESFVLYSTEGRLEELKPELDNFRAAMRWSIDSGDARSAMRIATPLNSVLVWLGHRAEADSWLTEALGAGGGEVSDLVASAIGTLAANLDLSGDPRRAVELQRQAGEMFAALGNASSLLWSMVYLGHSLHFCGEYAEEVKVYERAAALAEEVGDKTAASLIPFLQAWLAIGNGDSRSGQALVERILDFGDDAHAGARVGVEVFRGLCGFLEGAHMEASRQCDAPIAKLLAEFLDAAGNEDPMGLWCLNLVGTFEMTETITRARGSERIADLLPRARRTGLLAAFPNPLDSISAVAAIERRSEEAARLMGAVDRLRRDTGIEMRYAVTQEMVDRGREQARGALGEEAYSREVDRGSRLSLPETIDLALEVLGG